MTATLGKVGVQTEYTGDADQPPPEQGASEAARHPRRADRAADRLPDVRRGGRADPVRRRSRSARRSRLLFLLAEPDRLQHDHADPRLDDRHRRRRRLHAVHRHALQTGAARRHASARGRRLRVGDRGSRRDLRRRHGRDLDHRPGRDRHPVHHEARHGRRARRAHRGALRDVPAARPAGADRHAHRPPQGAVPARERRVRGGAARARCSAAGARPPCAARAPC